MGMRPFFKSCNFNRFWLFEAINKLIHYLNCPKNIDKNHEVCKLGPFKGNREEWYGEPNG